MTGSNAETRFINAPAVADSLASQGWSIVVSPVEVTASTNTDLINYFEHTRARTMILRIAHHQTAGRGTHGRAWNDASESLLFSLGLPSLPAAKMAPVPVLVGFAIAEEFQKLNVPVLVKWPNDLWLTTGKMGGILCEMAAGPSIVIGVGINLDLHQHPQCKADMSAAAALSSILPLEDVVESRTFWLLRAVSAILKSVGEYMRKSSLPDWSRWKKFDFLVGKRISVDNNAGQLETGLYSGIDAQGALCLRDEKGVLRRFISGTVRILEAS